MSTVRQQLKPLVDELYERIADQLARELPALLIIHKASRRTDHQNYLSARRRADYMQREILEPAVNEWFKKITKPLERGAAKAARARTPASGANKIADWKELEKIGLEAMHGPFLRALAYSIGAATENLMRKQADPAGDRAIEYTDKHTADLVTSVTRGTKDAIKQYIAEMVRYGMTAQKVAQNLRPVVGLLPRHATAVGRFLTKQLDKGVPYEDAAKKAQRYANKLHRYRTRMIARTESSFAQSEGTLQAYEGMGITHVKWIADPEACPICRARNGKVYPISQAHGMQPAHPHCECTWVAASEPKEEPRIEREHMLGSKNERELYDMIKADYAAAGIPISAEDLDILREDAIRNFLGGGAAQLRWAQLGEKDKFTSLINYKKALKQARLLDQYIEIAPSFPAETEIMRGFRSLHTEALKFAEAIEKTKIGSTIQFDVTTHWTTSARIADRYDGGTKGIIFKTKGVKNSTTLKHFSNYWEEEEVGISSSQKFKITGKKKVGDHIEVTLEPTGD